VKKMIAQILQGVPSDAPAELDSWHVHIMRHLRGVPLVDWAATSISVAIDKQAIGKSSYSVS
jgi:hypothetical protein